MNTDLLEKKITQIWNGEDNDDTSEIVNEVIELADQGAIRVVDKINGEYVINQWLKQAILLSFRYSENYIMENGANSTWYDKVPSKFCNWQENDFIKAGFRAVPGCYVRKGSFVAKNVILMPSFINIGAYVDQGTMVDTWASIGSCAQIGKNCHISGGAGIGGVLEPLQANPVIIEDDVFVGARSEIVEGVVVGKGSVISMGVYIGISTKIVDRETNEVFYGKIPEYSVVVPGSFKQENSDISLYCAVIVKKVDEKTRSKTAINDILRSTTG